MNSKPKNEEPSDILTCPINSLVVGSWYAEVAVTLATTPDPAPIITSFNWISNNPGVALYVPAVLLKVNAVVTEIWVPYTGVFSCCATATVPSCALVTLKTVDERPSTAVLTKNISEPNWYFLAASKVLAGTGAAAPVVGTTSRLVVEVPIE